MQSVRASRVSARQAATRHLRHAILAGEIPAGTRLLLREIAKQLELSTTPVREAIGVLANEGLVQVDPYRGAYVSKPSIEELREIYELRAIVEEYGMRLSVPQLTEEEISRAEALVNEMALATDMAEWLLLNRTFHALISEGARSRSISQVMGILRDVSSMYIAISFKASPARLRESNEEHRRIVQACRRRDVEKVAELARNHVLGTIRLLEAELEHGAMTSTVLDS